MLIFIRSLAVRQQPDHGAAGVGCLGAMLVSTCQTRPMKVAVQEFMIPVPRFELVAALGLTVGVLGIRRSILPII